MIRVLIFILSAVLVASTVTYFASMSEWVRAEAFGSIITFHAGAAMGLAFILLILIIFFTIWFKDLAALPGKMREREREARRTRGVAALTRGLEAVAVGDALDAQHHARVASRNLDDAALTRLLSAQAAQLAGDDDVAGESFTAMLEAPETEFLGLRGLYMKALRENDKTAAREYAERAFRLRPNASWAFESVLDLGLERGAWGQTRAAVTTAVKNKIIAVDKGKRAETALLAADAFAASLAGDDRAALQDAEAALKLSPDFAPAAVLAAERHIAAGRRGRAAKILETAFAANPHPALVAAHEALFADADKTERAMQLKKIADRYPLARNGRLAMARRANLLEQHAEAMSILEPLLMEKATAREASEMAQAVAGAHGGDAATVWLEKAAAAPRDPEPGADGAFHFTRDGWARLVREYMDHGRLAPPPLEDAPKGLTAEDLKLLAPPLKTVAEPPQAQAQAHAEAHAEAEAEAEAAGEAPFQSPRGGEPGNNEQAESEPATITPPARDFAEPEGSSKAG